VESGVDRSFSREFQDQEKDLIRKFSQPKKEDLGEGSRERISWNNEQREEKRGEKTEVKENEKVNVEESEIETEIKGNKKEKIERFSSSGSDTQEQIKDRTGSITYLFLYNTYEQDMVKCTNCGDFAHEICYQIKLSEKFDCAKCKQKNGCETGNKEIDLYKKIDRTMKRKSLFLNLTEDEYFNCQPGLEPSTEFMKIRFGFSSSYAARIT